jgi:hypothetical protein
VKTFNRAEILLMEFAESLGEVGSEVEWARTQKGSYFTRSDPSKLVLMLAGNIMEKIAGRQNAVVAFS